MNILEGAIENITDMAIKGFLEKYEKEPMKIDLGTDIGYTLEVYAKPKKEV